MIKEQQRVSAFHSSLTRRSWLLGHAGITTMVCTLSPPGSNPGIRCKSSKTPGVYSKARALAACYLPETRAPTYELCNHWGHWCFSTTAANWRHSAQHTMVQKWGNKSHREPQNELPQSLSSFSWHEVDRLTFREDCKKLRLLSRWMGVVEVLQEAPGWGVSEIKYLLWCLLSCSLLFCSDCYCISAENEPHPDIQLRQKDCSSS